MSTICRVHCLGAALLMALSAELAAHGHHHHDKPEPPRPLDGLGASAVYDAMGVLWSVSKAGGHVVLHSSTTQGRSWSFGRAVNIAPEPIDDQGDARPKIAVGPQGELYVSWRQPLAKPGLGHIRFARSLDRGRTFSVPMTVHADRDERAHRFDTLTVDGKGRVYVAWAATKSMPALYYAVSEDSGASFRGDYKLADDDCGVALLPTADGNVIAFWRHAFDAGSRDFALASVRPDGRIENLRRATFDNQKAEACPAQAPVIAEDRNGRLHGVWWTSAGSAAYGRLRDGAVEGVRQIGGAKTGRPDLALLGSSIALAWKEVDGEGARLRALRSDDGGSTWRELTLASTPGAADEPRLVVLPSGFRVFWNTRTAPRSVHFLP